MGNKQGKAPKFSSFEALREAIKDGVLDKKECQALFKRYDKDSSGSIEREEISNIIGDILKTKGNDPTEVDEMVKTGGFIHYEKQLFSYFDTNDKNGKIEQGEFVEKFPSYVASLIKKEIKSEDEAKNILASAVKDGTLDKAKCSELFKGYDKDGSGCIERAEIKYIIGDILKAKGQPATQVDEMLQLGGFVHYEQQLFKIFDTGDKDGKIDEEEFVAKFPGYVESIVRKGSKKTEEKKE